MFSHDKDPLNRTADSSLKLTKKQHKMFFCLKLGEYFGASNVKLNESFYDFVEQCEVNEQDSTDFTCFWQVIYHDFL